jgi:hypothetical protein
MEFKVSFDLFMAEKLFEIFLKISLSEGIRRVQSGLIIKIDEMESEKILRKVKINQ